MSCYSISGPALRDLEQIRDYIAADSPRAALRVMREFRETFRRIAARPGIGHVRRELRDDSLRVVSLYNYLVIYTAQRPVRIVRVIHGARDLEELWS